ncbi:hypothetical protein HO133_008964 [Letharia lupina]|uniref:Uncharacterized protein n=1 Tax=Letharia lupina TaxID=560253 RepID=A0A8H6FFM9_9LECA|nr:uncharacterized protein HO133_008964 [Letharia lupina]KAF6226099.1 hypothetical protein HO133_008964 [Letharia lupina]
MSDNKQGGVLSVPDQASEPIVAFYLTQETDLPVKFQGEYQVVTIKIPGSSGQPVQKPALRVTFAHDQSIEELVGLVGFGSDPRCHLLLPADVVDPVHCRVYAQLNSGPQVWLVDDSSTQGTQVEEDQDPRHKSIKTVHGRRQAVQGLHAVRIGPYLFKIRAPVSNTEVRRREDWFRLNKPIPVTRKMLDRQLDGLAYDWLRMDRVGSGAFGNVYRYMERNTALFIAIKEERTRSKEHKAMVMQEIKFMKSLRHPFLVDILFSHSDNKALPMFLTAMPLYFGNLGSILPLPNMSTTERVMLQIAEGLRFMHSNLILHRDLKPANVLVTSQENIKIADYGWATSLNDTVSLYDPEGRCSLDECIQIVEAQDYDWIKPTPLMPVATPTRFATGTFGVHGTANATRLQQTPFDQAKATADMPKLTPFARVNRSENRQSPQQAPGKPGYKNWRPIVQREEPAAPNPQAVRTPKPCKPTHVQGVNFNAGLPSYEDATRQNPFAVKTSKGEKDKKSAHTRLDVSDRILGHRTKEPPVLRAPLPAVGKAPKGGSPRVEALSVVRAGPLASIRGRQPQNPRQLVRRSREHTMNIDRAQNAGVRKRREQLDRQAERNRRVADLKRGACDVAKGYFVIYRALFGLAFEGLAVGSERIYKMFNDQSGARKALEHAIPNMNANAQLMASMQRQSLRAASSNRLTAGVKQRSFRVYTDEEMMDHQLMLPRRR